MIIILVHSILVIIITLINTFYSIQMIIITFIVY